MLDHKKESWMFFGLGTVFTGVEFFRKTNKKKLETAREDDAEDVAETTRLTDEVSIHTQNSDSYVSRFFAYFSRKTPRVGIPVQIMREYWQLLGEQEEQLSEIDELIKTRTHAFSEQKHVSQQLQQPATSLAVPIREVAKVDLTRIYDLQAAHDDYVRCVNTYPTLTEEELTSVEIVREVINRRIVHHGELRDAAARMLHITHDQLEEHIRSNMALREARTEAKEPAYFSRRRS